jgi:hypothetical protein
MTGGSKHGRAIEAQGKSKAYSYVVVCLVVCFIVGCSRASQPSGTATQTVGFNQPSQTEVSFFKQQAQELHQRILIYEDLFGSESDWVKGTRLLERFYEESALGHDRIQPATPRP